MSDEKAPPPYDEEKQPGSYPPAQPPPVQGYGAPQTQQDTTTVFVQQPASVQFGESPVTLPDGGVTTIQYRSGLLTYLVAGGICILTGCWCVSLCVLCIDALKDVEHIHPETGQIVGVYKRVQL